jgi:hypothetical protein
MRRTAVWAALVSGVLCLGCGRGFSESDWKDLRPDGQKFSAKMPGEPKLKQQEASTGAGPITVNQYVVEGRSYAYIVGYTDYPAKAIEGANPEGMLDGGRDGALKNVRGAKLSKEEKIQLDGHPGRELHVDIPGKGKLVARFYLVKNRLYQLLAAGDDVTPEDKDVRRFLESLTLEK